jgi:hypothetical protein
VLPLTIPAELWEALPEAQQRVYRGAQWVLDALWTEHELSFATIVDRTGFSPEESLKAVQALDAMNLVSFAPAPDDVLVQLVAIPDEHVRFVGPDGEPRWVFIARPLEAPEIEKRYLN